MQALQASSLRVSTLSCCLNPLPMVIVSVCVYVHRLPRCLQRNPYADAALPSLLVRSHRRTHSCGMRGGKSPELLSHYLESRPLLFLFPDFPLLRRKIPKVYTHISHEIRREREKEEADGDRFACDELRPSLCRRSFTTRKKDLNLLGKKDQT